MASSSTSAITPLPEAEMHILAHSDGSSTYSFPGGYSIACVVNGPLEVMRRDELPHEMHVEVHVRPGAGLGGPAFRHLEALIRPLLTSTILVRSHPRTLLQLTLQVLSSPTASTTYPPSLSSSHPQGCTSLLLLPHLINAAELALLDGGIPLSTILTSTAVGIDEKGSPVRDIKSKSSLKSLHVFAFAPVRRECLFVESAGDFSPKEYQQAYQIAVNACCGGQDSEHGDSPQDLHRWLRATVEAFVEEQGRWKLEAVEER